MADSNAELALLIGSRICHDLISPVGAILNGLELLELTGPVSGPEHELISDSARNANARLRFFRIAYGRAGGQSLGRSEVGAILKDLTRNTRLEIIWQPSSPQERSEVRLAFLALQCCESAMPHGGRITVSREGLHWRIDALPEKPRTGPDPLHRLAEPTSLARTEPAQVHFALFQCLLAEAGRSAVTETSAEAICIRF